MDKVRCAKCGFLSMFNHSTRQHEEALPDFRKDGRGEFGAWGGAFNPGCFIGAQQVWQEINALKDAPSSDIFAATFEVMDKERVCTEYFEWHPGASPREHREMLNQQELRALAERRLDEDRKWREESLKRQEDWQSDSLSRQEEWEKKNTLRLGRWTVLAAVIGAAITGLGTYAITRLTEPPAPSVSVSVPAQSAPVVNNYVVLPTPVPSRAAP